MHCLPACPATRGFTAPGLSLLRHPLPHQLCCADPDLTTLALGTDLTTLGLNLNSPEALWKTFASPWADGPGKPEPDFKVCGLGRCSRGIGPCVCREWAAVLPFLCSGEWAVVPQGGASCSGPRLGCLLASRHAHHPASDLTCCFAPQVPACYLHSPPRLQPGYFSKFQVGLWHLQLVAFEDPLVPLGSQVDAVLSPPCSAG